MSQTNAHPATKTVQVFVNRRKIDLPAGPITAPTLLAAAGFEGTAWDLLALQGEGDPAGGTLLQADAVIDLKPGLHFRVLPGNRTFGATPLEQAGISPEEDLPGAEA